MEQAQSFRAALLASERASAVRLVKAYGTAWADIRCRLDLLTTQIQKAKLAGETVNYAWLLRQERYRALLGEIAQQIGRFADLAEREITREQRAGVVAAQRDSQRLLLAAAEDVPTIDATFNRLPSSAFENLVGFLGNGSPLKSLLDELPRNAGRKVQDELIKGLAAGRGARAIASGIRDALGGNMTRALMISRTEVLRSYRNAALQTFQENSEVLDGWYWMSARNSRCCAACIALHGTYHLSDEPFKSHVNCRCAPIPAIKGEPSPIKQSGEDWFADQSAKAQRDILGTDDAYEAYRSGRLRLRDFVGRKDSPDWGASYYQLSVGRAFNNEGRFPDEPKRPGAFLAALVKPPGPRGVPIKNALRLPTKGDFSRTARNAVSAIDSVHGDGDLPSIPVLQDSAKNRLGGYRYFNNGKAVDIRISRRGDHQELTLAHEIGHFLDNQGIGNPKQMETKDGSLFDEFMKVASQSRAIQSLRDQLKLRAYEVTTRAGAQVKLPVNRKYLQYLLQKDETWARAYSQYIAHRSGNPQMLDQVRQVRENDHPGTAASQWADDDFEPIAREIDRVMEQLGWRKN